MAAYHLNATCEKLVNSTFDPNDYHAYNEAVLNEFVVKLNLYMDHALDWAEAHDDYNLALAKTLQKYVPDGTKIDEDISKEATEFLVIAAVFAFETDWANVSNGNGGGSST